MNVRVFANGWQSDSWKQKQWWNRGCRRLKSIISKDIHGNTVYCRHIHTFLHWTCFLLHVIPWHVKRTPDAETDTLRQIRHGTPGPHRLPLRRQTEIIIERRDAAAFGTTQSQFYVLFRVWSEWTRWSIFPQVYNQNHQSSTDLFRRTPTCDVYTNDSLWNSFQSFRSIWFHQMFSTNSN